MKVTIYRFQTYNMPTGWTVSSRWGTREGVERLEGASVIEGTGIEIDDAVLGRMCPGISDEGFNPEDHA